jgi:hypothetical protein
VVREPSPVLTARRTGAALAALAAFDLLAPHIDHGASTAMDITGLALVSIPLATLTPFALEPLARLGPRLLAGAMAAAGATALLIWAGFPGTPATLTKLLAASLIGLTLASLLQSPVEIVGIAVLIAVVDIYSVAAGPTKVIVEHHEQVLNAFTLAFHPLGSEGVAQIGASDFVFFAVFLAAARVFGLRPAATWAAMTASFGVTLYLSYELNRALPALPLLSLAFLGANAGHLADRIRGRAGSPEGDSSP